MTDKLHTDTREKPATIYYMPGVQDSGDLETAAKSIVRTAEASGLQNADYNRPLTIPQPADLRLTVKRLAARLAVNIDSFDVATHLYCRVYVDIQDADHRLFDMDWTGSGSKLIVADTFTGNKTTVFNLLKDGAAHTFYFFFWVNQANNAVISLVQLWEGVACSDSTPQPVLDIAHDGFISLYCRVDKQGTGSSSLWLCLPDTYDYISKATNSVAYEMAVPAAIVNNFHLRINASVATDLWYLHIMHITLW